MVKRYLALLWFKRLLLLVVVGVHCRVVNMALRYYFGALLLIIHCLPLFVGGNLIVVIYYSIVVVHCCCYCYIIPFVIPCVGCLIVVVVVVVPHVDCLDVVIVVADLFFDLMLLFVD
jgi:hypothetical protein